jgi:hypothetical protein
MHIRAAATGTTLVQHRKMNCVVVMLIVVYVLVCNELWNFTACTPCVDSQLYYFLEHRLTRNDFYLERAGTNGILAIL